MTLPLLASTPHKYATSTTRTISPLKCQLCFYYMSTFMATPHFHLKDLNSQEIASDDNSERSYT